MDLPIQQNNNLSNSDLRIESDTSDFLSDSEFESDPEENEDKKSSCILRSKKPNEFELRRKLMSEFLQRRHKNPVNEGSKKEETSPTINTPGGSVFLSLNKPVVKQISFESPTTETATPTITLLDGRQLKDIIVQQIEETESLTIEGNIVASADADAQDRYLKNYSADIADEQESQASNELQVRKQLLAEYLQGNRKLSQDEGWELPGTSSNLSQMENSPAPPNSPDIVRTSKEKIIAKIALLDGRELKDIIVPKTDETEDKANSDGESKKSSPTVSIFGFRNAFATFRSKRRSPLQRSNTDTSRPIVVKHNRSSLNTFSSRENSSLMDQKSTASDPNECIQQILEEFIATEESYVSNLWNGIKNYANIFQRSDLPEDLEGKEYDLLANIETIAVFHRDQVLPMLQNNREDAERFFTELRLMIENNHFHIYVAYTINKRRSMQLIARHKNYFLNLEREFRDRLGISSFLLEPIQRMARYPLLVTQCISNLFKLPSIQAKALVTSCCRLETKLRILLNTINESESVNDIVDINITNMLHTFRRVGSFEIQDHGRWRSFNGKLFLFDKCLIVTKIVGKLLVFRKRYSCDTVKIADIEQGFSLFYGNRDENKCDFLANPEQIELWLKLLQEVITTDPVENLDGDSLHEELEEYSPLDYEKVSEFRIYDRTLDRKYPAKVFLFDKCITYAELRQERLILRGSYPFDHVGIMPTDESFTLFYDRRHQQECDFMGSPKLIKVWLDLIHGQISKHFKRKMSVTVKPERPIAEDSLDPVDTVDCSSLE